MRRRLVALTLAALAGSVLTGPVAAADPTATSGRGGGGPEGVRFATYNASLNRNTDGQLVRDLSTPDNAQAGAVAEIIQRTRPDVVLVNEFDFDAGRVALGLFQRNYLGVSRNGSRPIWYPFAYTAPSNTGVPSGLDLNNDGSVGGPDDAYGFGFFPGQFGMAVYSRFPIRTEDVRTFQRFLWKDLPGARLPDDPSTPAPADWFTPEELAAVRLSSKSHWDLPVEIGPRTVHFLVSHPTPPVFDGPEDRNGRRNADEIRLWDDYVTPGAAGYLYDDAGRRGGLRPGAAFVIAGDQNSDPNDGDSIPGAIQQLLDNPLVRDPWPTSRGAVEQARLQGGVNLTHRTPARYDTADFAEPPGNLRVDYVLPRRSLPVLGSGVFWPTTDDPLFRLVGVFPFPTSDHKLVWVDLRLRGDGYDFLGQATLPPGTSYRDTTVGGLSGITYDPQRRVYYAISDDRSQLDPARFYTLRLDLRGGLSDGDVTLLDVTTLLDDDGQPFEPLSLDPEGIALTRDRRLVITSEGDASRLIDPFVRTFRLDGRSDETFEVPAAYRPDAAGTRGVRTNLGFESAGVTPDGRTFFTGTENALVQDGPAAAVGVPSPSRLLRYDARTGRLEREYRYLTDPVAQPPVPPDAFAVNGLVELLPLGGRSLLAMERSFSVGVGNAVRIYRVTLDGGTARKSLLFDLADLGITLDNVEGMTFGPRLPDGRRSLVLVSDDNFSPTQVTQFLAFAVPAG